MQTARSTQQTPIIPTKRMSWTVADVQKECICDRTFWTSTDALQDAQVVLELDSTQRECRARIEEEMVDKGDAITIETGGEIAEEPDANLKKRKNGEPSLTADTTQEERI